MANSSREALLHSAMDQLVSRVRKWKAGNGPVGPNQARDLCHKHKDDIYKCFQESGLQAWEFHTMLHRASEYGLVEDMKGLWSEVATTFLQMRSGSGYGSFDSQGQHMQPGFGQPQQQQAGLPGSAPKANGVYGASYMPNGRSSNSSVAVAGNKPPGLNRQGQQGSAYAAAPASRSPQDDVTGTSTDQHTSRKQQHQQQQQQAKPGGRSSSAGKGAAMQGGNQQQQGRVPAGKQQATGTAAGAAAAAGGKGTAAAAAPAGPAAAAASDAVGAMSNGYISAWRNGPDAASSKPGPSLMSGFMSGAGFQQQQLQQQASMEPLQQGMDQQQQEEPLDLLPLGLLDDVYDQGDAVVDGPAKGKASGKPAAKQQAQQQGKQQQSAKPRGAQQQQQQQAQQQGRSQQKAPAAQQQPAQNSRSVSAPSASSHQQQQQQADALSAFEGVSVVGPLSPTARPFAPSLSVGPFLSQQQQQQQQQQPQLGGFDVTSPLAGLQQRASMEALHQQQQQQQILMLQQQARYYQQQQMGMWGSTAPQMPYMHPLGAPGMPMQPPPPPRNLAAAAAAAAPGSSQPGAIAAAAAQQAPAKPGYAAVAAGLSAAQGSNSGSNGLAAAPAGSSSDAGSSLGDISHSSAGAPMSYRGSLGLSAAPGGPVSHPAAADTDRRLQENVAPGPAGQQQQQMQAPSGAVGAESAAHSSLLSASSGPLQQQQGLLGLQQQPAAAGAIAGGIGSSNGSKSLMPAGLSLFQGASYDSPLNGPLLGSSSTGAAVGAGPLSPYPSPMHRSLSGVPSGGASPALTSLAASGPQGNSSLGMAPMLLPPSALGAIGEPVGSHVHLQQQQQSAPAAPRPAWGGAPGRAVAPPPAPAAAADEQLQQDTPAQSNMAKQAAAVPAQQQQQEMPVGSLGSVGSGRGIVPDSSSSSASSSVTAPAAASVSSPQSIADSSPNALGRTQAQAQQQQGAVAQTAADASAVQQQSPQQRGQIDGTAAQQSPARQQQQQQVPASPGKPLTWAQKLKKAEATGSAAPNGPASASAAAAAAAGNGAGWGVAASGAHTLVSSGSSSGPRIAPAPKSELSAAGAAAGGSGGISSRGMHKTTGQALLAAAKQQEEEAAAAAAAAVPTYSEAAALEGLDETTAKAAVTAASRMPLPAKLIQAWRSGMCLGSLIKLLQSQRPDLATAVNDRIKGWLCQDCDRSTAECLVLFVLANLRRDWHMTAKNPGAFLMGLLQHRAALIGGSGLSRKLLETARNFPNVAVYIDSDVLQELGDMEPELRGFVMDEYMCKQRHDWPEGLKFPSQCLLSCMRSIRYADPAVHRAYIQLLASRPDLSKACNGVILYGLCKCDKATGLAAVKRLSELPEAWTSAARVNASAFLYQKVQELCGGHGCY